jgi:hypothetical protein
MTISAPDVGAIQRAGEAVYGAHAALADASQAQARLVTEAMASNPFGLENDALYYKWKTLARLAQELEAMEQQLRSIHETACSLSDNELVVSNVLLLPAPDKLKQPRGRQLVKREARSMKHEGNDGKVMSHLAAILKSGTYSRVVLSRVAHAAGIPGGSIARSIKNLLDLQQIAQGKKGWFKLAQ